MYKNVPKTLKYLYHQIRNWQLSKMPNFYNSDIFPKRLTTWRQNITYDPLQGDHRKITEKAILQMLKQVRFHLLLLFVWSYMIKSEFEF